MHHTLVFISVFFVSLFQSVMAFGAISNIDACKKVAQPLVFKDGRERGSSGFEQNRKFYENLKSAINICRSAHQSSPDDDWSAYYYATLIRQAHFGSVPIKQLLKDVISEQFLLIQHELNWPRYNVLFIPNPPDPIDLLPSRFRGEELFDISKAIRDKFTWRFLHTEQLWAMDAKEVEKADTILQALRSKKFGPAWFEYAMSVKSRDLETRGHSDFSLLLAKAAGYGSGQAALLLGFNAYYGLGWRQDINIAYRYFLEAAKSGEPDALVMVGIINLFGLRQPIDHPNALNSFKAAAQNGSQVGQLVTGLFYKGGVAVEQNTQRAEFWFNEAAGNNQLGQLAILAKISLEAQISLKNIERLYPQVIRGSYIGYYLNSAQSLALGRQILAEYESYEYQSWAREVLGFGLFSTSADLVRQRAKKFTAAPELEQELKFVSERLYLAAMVNFEQPDQTTLILMNAAANLNHEDSRIKLNEIRDNLFQKPDFQKMLDSAQAGDAKAQAMMAHYSSNGVIDFDDAKSLEWTKLAASQGHTRSMVDLVNHYEYVMSGEEGTAKAQQILINLVELGHEPSIVRRVRYIWESSPTYKLCSEAKKILDQRSLDRTENSRSLNEEEVRFYFFGCDEIQSYQLAGELMDQIEFGDRLKIDLDTHRICRRGQRYPQDLPDHDNLIAWLLERGAEDTLCLAQYYFDSGSSKLDIKRSFVLASKAAQGRIGSQFGTPDGPYPPAQYFLAQRYLTGKGVPQSYSKAELWMSRALEGGYEPARKGLQRVYAEGADYFAELESLMPAEIQQKLH